MVYNRIKILCATLALCVFAGACARAPLPAPKPSPAGEHSRLRFTASLNTETLEVPLHGVLRLESDAAQGWRAERVGVVMTHGPTVGVCVWQEENLVCEASDLPNAQALLTAVAVAAGEIARHRGIQVSTTPPQQDAIQFIARDATGPVELHYMPRKGTRVAVRVTGDER